MCSWQFLFVLRLVSNRIHSVPVTLHVDLAILGLSHPTFDVTILQVVSDVTFIRPLLPSCVQIGIAHVCASKQTTTPTFLVVKSHALIDYNFRIKVCKKKLMLNRYNIYMNVMQKEHLRFRESRC